MGLRLAALRAAGAPLVIAALKAILNLFPLTAAATTRKKTYSK